MHTSIKTFPSNHYALGACQSCCTFDEPNVSYIYFVDVCERYSNFNLQFDEIMLSFETKAKGTHA